MCKTRGFNRCRGRDFCDKFVALLDQMDLTPFQREMIKSRFVTEVSEIEFDYARSVFLFIGLTNLVTVAGILITSFTTLTKAITVDAYWQNILSWMVWTLSLALTLANGWLTTFGIYKKYVLNDVTLDKMYNEGWSFIEGVNRYEKLPMEERIVTFCSKVEQIITKTTIKQLSDNTAGVNVHEILEVPNEPAPEDVEHTEGTGLLGTSNTNGEGTSNTNGEGTSNTNGNDTAGNDTAGNDTIISIPISPEPSNNLTRGAYPKRKKKTRPRASINRHLLD